ncbi:MAG: hypothetical protein Kow0037_17520 [Calditrichia bacterium]
MLKQVIGLMIILFLIVGCGSNKEKLFNEMRRLEYLRQVDEKRFVEWLNHPDAEVRVRAVEALGRIQDERAIPWLRNRMADPAEEVRKAAAFALGQTFSIKAEEPVIDAIKVTENDWDRAWLAEALGKVGTQKAFMYIRDYLEGKKVAWERNGAVAAGILAYRGYPPYSCAQALGVLLQASPDPEVRWRSAYALYRMGAPGELKAAFMALNDGPPLTRYFSLKAISVMVRVMRSPQYEAYKNSKLMADTEEIVGSDEFYDGISLMMQDTTWFVRAATVQLMGNLKNRHFLKILDKHLTDPHPYVRIEVLKALTQFGKPAEEILIRHYEDTGNWRERGQALLSLSKLNTAAAFKRIKEDLLQIKWPENYFHIQALAEVGTPEARALLLQLADQDNVAQTTRVLETPLDKLQFPMGFLVQKLRLHDAALTTIISTYLGQLRNPQVSGELINAYKSFLAPRDIEPMIAILAALDSLRSPSATNLLEQELANPFPAIRQAAWQALLHITGKKYQIPEVASKPLTRFDFALPNPDSRPKVLFKTSKGEFVMELRPDKAPVTVANFLDLVRSGFYNNLTFHRVVPGFVVQGGDPRGDGWGGPGYTIPCEYNDLFYERGAVGMAHAGKDTGGSQFFITHTPQPHLNGRHTLFGKVVSGMKVVDRLEIYDTILSATVID